MQRRPHAHPGRIVGTLAAATVLVLGGCVSQPRPPSPAPPAPLQLLSAGQLDLPEDCEPADGRVYRTNFVVETDGRVTGARPDSGDGCVQEALRTWVSTFRYAPVDAAVPAVLDWLAVTASRGS